MKTLFVSICASLPKVPTKLLTKTNEVGVAANECLNLIQQDLWEVGIQTKNAVGVLHFDVRNFTHHDVISLIQSLQYNYADFGGVSFPTNKYSDNGKDMEYYLVKRYEDYDCTLCINRTAGTVTISDMRYVEANNDQT